MEDWYWIGVLVGIGVALGVLFTALLASSTTTLFAAGLLAVAGGGALGLALAGWAEGVGGALGGLAGTVGGAPLARGTLERGGTRGGTALLLAAAAVGLAALAFVPIFGYLAGVAVPALAARMRRRAGRRYAGLRTLAKD